MSPKAVLHSYIPNETGHCLIDNGLFSNSSSAIEFSNDHDSPQRDPKALIIKRSLPRIDFGSLDGMLVGEQARFKNPKRKN